MSQSEHDSQEHVLRTYTVLQLLQQDWGGSIILCCGLGLRGTALALASNIAGAVFLGIEEDPDTLKVAIRSGSCDFIVNTLDEALRTMKNEVRKKTPLSIGLQGNITLVLEEIFERGVSPQLFTDTNSDSTYSAANRKFKALGAMVVDLGPTPPTSEILDSNILLENFLLQKKWHPTTFTLTSPATLRTFDAKAAIFLSAEDQLRRRWLHSASKIVQRARPLNRVLWLTEQEKLTLQADLSA